MNTQFILAVPFVLRVALIASAAELPDLGSVAPDLTTPTMIEATPAPGTRVKCVAEEYRGTDVYHCLYLPVEWQLGQVGVRCTEELSSERLSKLVASLPTRGIIFRLVHAVFDSRTYSRLSRRVLAMETSQVIFTPGNPRPAIGGK